MTDELSEMDKILLKDFETKLSGLIDRHIARIARSQNNGVLPTQYNATGETFIILSALSATLARRVKEKGGRPDDFSALLFVLEGMLYFSRDRMQALADMHRAQPQRLTIVGPEQ